MTKIPAPLTAKAIGRWSIYGEKMRIFRFELNFDGAPQNVGLLQGWNDILAPNEEHDNLLSVFEALPCPKVEDDENGSCIVFWFTEKGINDFKEDLQLVLDTVWDHTPWGVIICESDVSSEALGWALYQDEWQIAWSYQDVHSDGAFSDDYREIYSIDEIIK